MPLTPQYDVPNVELTAVVSSDVVNLTLYVGDYKGFMDSLLSIKEGGKKRFTRFLNDKTITLNIINTEARKILEEP